MEDQPARPADPPAPPAPAETPEAGPAPENAPASESVPEPVPADTSHALAENPAEPAPRRPRGRTTLLVAAAALLGVVAGVATGYTVQADRKPTPLPPLSQAKLSYPDKHVPADEWEPVPAEHDRRVKTDGDLRKLLVKKPKGARASEFDRSEDGWLPLTAYADEFTHPGHIFGTLIDGDVRRVAAVDWKSGSYRRTSVRLVQFDETENRFAYEYVRQQQEYMPGEAGTAGELIKGSVDGLYFVDRTPVRKPGYLPGYANRAIASRGDIMMDIFIRDTEPISEKEIRELAERQWERL